MKQDQVDKASQYPFARTPLTCFVAELVAKIADPKKLESVARSAGYQSSEMLLRIANGEARATLDKAHRMAVAFGVSPAFVLGLGMTDHWPDLSSAVAVVLCSRIVNPEDPVIRHDPGAASEIGLAGQEATSDSDGDRLVEPDGDGQTNLNFKVLPNFHRRFRVEAARRALTMKQLLEACFESLAPLEGKSSNLKDG